MTLLKKLSLIVFFVLVVIGSSKSQQFIYQKNIGNLEVHKTLLKEISSSSKIFPDKKLAHSYTKELEMSQSEFLTPELNLKGGISFLTFMRKEVVLEGGGAKLSVYLRTDSADSWKLIASFENMTEQWDTDTLFIPEMLGPCCLRFIGESADSDAVLLDDIRISWYKNATAASIGHNIYVDTEFNLSSSFLCVPVSGKQVYGLPGYGNDQMRTPGVPVVCPSGNDVIIENEPDCYTNYKDSTNQGCDTIPNHYTELKACNGKVCGKSGIFLYKGIPRRDTDWYRLVYSGASNDTLKVVADFRVKIYLFSMLNGCDGGYTPVVASSTQPGGGDTVKIGLGNYVATPYLYFWVAPYSASNTVPCGSNYILIYKTTTFTTPSAPVPAANPACSSTVLNPMSSPLNYTYYWQGSSCGINTVNPATASYPITSSGNYYVRGIYTPLGCWTPCSSVNVTVNNPPSLTISANPTTVCSGSQSVLTAGGATAYSWQPGGLSGSLLNVNPISSTIYTVTGTLAGCTSSSTVTVTTNPYPATPGSISGSSSLCAGTSGAVYSVGAIADATSYIWSYSGTGAIINGNGTNVTINFSTNATSGLLTVKGNNSCGDGPISGGYSITIKPLPNVTASANPTAVCVGSPSSLTAVGNATSYTWQPGSLSGSPVNVTPGSITTYTVTGNLNGCTSTSTVTVSTNPYPAPAGTITGSSSLCTGSSGAIYSVGAITDATSYIWSYSGNGASINGNGIIVTINFSTSATSGVLTVKGNNACGDGTPSNAYPITIKPLPNVSATANPTTVCAGSVSTLTATGNAGSYSWLPGSLSGSFVNVMPNSNTIYTVTGDLNGCTSTSTVTVSTNPYPAPAGSIIGNISVCPGTNSVTYNVGPIADATSYVWLYSGTGAIINGSGTNITMDFSTNSTSGQLTVKGNNSCGDGPISNAYSITVKPLPNVSASANPATVCSGSVSTLTAAGNANSYSWLPGSLSGSSVNVSPIANTVYTLTGDLNGCTSSSTVTVSTNPYPASTGSIYGNSSLCAGTTGVNYSTGTITDATSYIWSYSGTGALINGTGTNVTLNFSSNATSGLLTVRGNNSCGDGPVSSGFPITVKPLPNVSASANPTSICIGSSSALTALGNAVSYSWQPGSLSGSPVNVSPGANTVYTVTGDLNGCTSTAMVSVSTNPYPAPAGSISGTTELCAGTNGVSYTVGSINDATSYGWNYTGTGITINGAGNTITADFSTNASSGLLTVKGNNACGYGAVSTAYSITIKPLPNITAAANPTAVCQGSFSVLTAVGNAVSYSWQPGSLSGVSVNVTPGSETIYTVTGDLNGCTFTAIATVSVNSYPTAAGSISGSASVCAGANAVSYNTGTIANATSYNWAYSGTGETIHGNGNSITVDFWLNATDGQLTVWGTNICGDGTVSSVYPVVVKPLPFVSSTALPNLICAGETSVLIAAGNSTSYLWQPGSLPGSPVNINPSVTTIYTLTGSLLGCTDTSTVTINVDPCTGISESNILDNITVGPVPVIDHLLIESNVKTDVTVSLYTVESKLLFVQQLKGERTYFIPLTNLPVAVYFLRIKSENAVKTFKILKQ